MANKRIDELDGLTTLGGNEEIAIVSSATTYHTTVAALKTHIVGGTDGLEARVRAVEAKLSAQGTPGTVQAACKVIGDKFVTKFNVKAEDGTDEPLIHSFASSMGVKINFSKKISNPIPFVTAIQPFYPQGSTEILRVYEITEEHCIIVSNLEKMSSLSIDVGDTTKPSNYCFSVIGS